MKILSNSKYAPCSIRDTVRVKIPDNDWGREDFRDIPVVDRTDDDFDKPAKQVYSKKTGKSRKCLMMMVYFSFLKSLS